MNCRNDDGNMTAEEPPPNTHTHTRAYTRSYKTEVLSEVVETRRSNEPQSSHTHTHTPSCCRSTAGAVPTAGQRGVLMGGGNCVLLEY